MLWFYYKSSTIDNAIDVWKNAFKVIGQELLLDIDVNWIGSVRLAKLMESGMVV